VKSIAAFLALPGRDRLLLLEAFATILGVRLALAMVPVDRVRTWAGHLKLGAGPADRLAWAVRTAWRRLPGTSCLAAALALHRVLSRQGHPSQLTIGVASGKDGFAAHAWVICDGKILLGGEESDGYTPLLAWESTGRPDSQ
jgi:transglutaminase superfamily protein